MSNCPILPIDKTLSGATTLGRVWPGSDGNERVLRIPQISGKTLLESHHHIILFHNQVSRWEGVLPSANMKSVFSIAPTVMVEIKSE